MSDIRMQSIFLDEEFIYEDVSDIKKNASMRQTRETTKSEMGHRVPHEKGKPRLNRHGSKYNSHAERYYNANGKQTAEDKKKADEDQKKTF